MKTNLSSQIKLDRIPKRYYAPDGELELAALTRDEKVYTKIFEGSANAPQKHHCLRRRCYGRIESGYLQVFPRHREKQPRP